MVDNELFKSLEETYGLEIILEQNDLEPWEVIRLLYMSGLLDLEDYFYSDVDEEDIKEDD